MTEAQDQEPAPKPVTYEELPPEHKKKYDEIKALLEADLIGSFEKIATMASGGRGSHQRALSTTLICLCHQRSAPEPYARR